MLDGKGLYRGSSILVSGTAGTGKSTIGAHFVDAACTRGERALFFAFEESQDQIISAGTGKGATFTIRLPRGVDSKRPLAPVLDLGNGTLRGLEVLVVDDSEDTTEMVQHLLEIGGATVCAVTSGSEALRIAREREFDVVLSDISMPELDGFQFLSELRKLPGKEDLPAVALTGFGRPEDVQRATEEGFYAHLTKPFDIETLARLLQNTADKRKSKRISFPARSV
jgi:CheY-like chemotaxis protein